jgi:predicted metal-dependent hydrolase
MNFLGKMLQLPLGLDTPASPSPPPAANSRRIALTSGMLDYGLVRARRRTLGILIGHRGVEVRAPRWTTLGEIERFLREKETWIWRHLSMRREERKSFLWNDGDSLPVFGQPVSLEIRRVATKPRERLVFLEDDRLVAQIRADDGVEKLRDLVQAWLREKLLATSTERVQFYSGRMAVPTPSIRLTNARTRWGSCSARGRVSLNWRLVHMPARLIDYVVAHEITHLREMNHSARFWNLLEEIYPHCRDARHELNALEKQLPNL